MPQSSRMETLDSFRNNEIRLLVASDVAARGLDIEGLSHVFNFDVPYHAEDYVHRIGRTGRAGKDGRAFSIASPSDTEFVSAIERLIGKEIPRAEVDGLETATFAPSDGKRGRKRRSGGKDRDKAPAKEAMAEMPDIKAANKKLKSANADKTAKEKEPADSNEPVIGMGAHVPAFMLRPARPQ